MVSGWLQGRTGLAVGYAVVTVAASSSVGMAVLQPESVEAWRVYVAAVERRIDGEAGASGPFLATDRAADAATRRSALRQGRVVVDELGATDGRGRDLDVPSAMVHHWRGAVFIPGARLQPMLESLRSSAPGATQPDVLASRILERRPDATRLFLRVQRRKFVTVVFNTEHLVRFTRLGAGRAASRSTATRIAEVANAGTPQEHELTPGHDRGFLWRWNAYWRYEEVPGGVIAECESVSLSRDLPLVVRALAGSMIRSTAHESMERTLLTLRTRFASAGTPPASPPVR